MKISISKSMSVVAFWSLLLLLGCSSNPHKAEVVETPVEKSATVAGNDKIGVNSDGEMVFQRKSNLAEELRKLQDDVFEMEDRVYGTRKYGTLGLYGKYSSCLRKVPSSDKGNLPKLEKLDRWSDKEENAKFGFDANKEKLAAVTEEKLRDRITKFQEYRRVLQEREDQYNENIRSCEAIAMHGKADS